MGARRIVLKRLVSVDLEISNRSDVDNVSILLCFFTSASASKEKEKEDNVDSGLSADKSESTSSEDRAAGPSDAVASEIVHVAPSSSNVRAILLNIRRPRRLRNYRKRKTPDGGDSDSNDSSQDSDDLSPEEGNMSRQADNTSDAETATFSDSSASM